MKKTIAAIATTLILSAVAHAQTILTVDLAEIYSNYYRAQEAQEKFNSNFETAQQEIRRMVEEGRGMTEQFQQLQAKAKNPALTESARQQAGGEAESLLGQIRRKEEELNAFRQQTEQSLSQRRQNIIELHFNEIKDVVTTIAKDRSADLVINTSGPGVVYHSDTLDVTQDVIKVLNANAPTQ